jgi:ketosteroid isomerase-like protein
LIQGGNFLPITNTPSFPMALLVRTPHLFAAAGLALCLASCGTAPAPAEAPAPAMDMAALNAQIQGMEDAYATASKAKDADAVMAYYADDLVSYSREKEPARGKEALRQRLAEGMAKDTLGITPSYKVEELFVGNDHVTEIGSWTDTDKTGTVTDHGTYFSIFRKNGDSWQCIRDISVSHKPKAEAAAVAQP